MLHYQDVIFHQLKSQDISRYMMMPYQEQIADLLQGYV